MHHVDRRTPWDEIWQAMEQLVRGGKVTYIGSSNFGGWDIATAQSVATSRHFLGQSSEQSLYNLSARSIELEVIPALRYYGIGLIPWSPVGKTNWPADELRKIAETDDVHISPFREGGVADGTPTRIWSVVVDDVLYVRGYNGQQSRWCQAAIHQKAGSPN
jgi:aryl-alcohol dehydrogenase-like predicted oxidoreductase